jgi:hypothetical protein
VLELDVDEALAMVDDGRIADREDDHAAAVGGAARAVPLLSRPLSPAGRVGGASPGRAPSATNRGHRALIATGSSHSRGCGGQRVPRSGPAGRSGRPRRGRRPRRR